MSNLVKTPLTPAAVFKLHFGTRPGTQDAGTECAMWERLCGKLLAEHERLLAKIEKERLEQIRREWLAIPIPATWEEALEQADRSLSVDDFIAEMETKSEA